MGDFTALVVWETPTGKFRLSMGIFPTEVSGFSPNWDFVFRRGRSPPPSEASVSSNRGGILPNFPPLVCWVMPDVTVNTVAICQAKQVGTAIFCIPCGARDDVDEAEARQFLNGGRDRVAVDTKLDEMLVGAGQATIVPAAMLTEFDFEAIEDAAGRET